MKQEENNGVARIIIAAVVIIVLILAIAKPKKEKFICEVCRDEVKQIPQMANSLPGYEGATFKWLYNLEYHDKLCDNCFNELELYLSRETEPSTDINIETFVSEESTDATEMETVLEVQEEQMDTEIWEEGTVDYANGKLGENIEWAISVDGILKIRGYGEMTDSPWRQHDDYIVEAIVYEGITTISPYCFQGCKNLKTVKLPESIEKMGRQAFQLCENLESISLPDKIKEIGESTFSRCYNLEVVEFPSELRMIHDWAFNECVSLTNIELPQKLELISNMAFEDCTGLVEVQLPQTLRVLGNEAFAGCKKLRKTNIPASVDSVYSVFVRCSDLREVRFEGDAPNISSNSFYGVDATCYYPKGNKTWTISKMSDYGGKLNWIGE